MPVTPAPCDSGRIGNYGGGAGAVSDPFLICSLAQWNYFAADSANWNGYFKLYSDIDFQGLTAATFKTVGNSTTPFTGSFDGNDFALKNILVTVTGPNDIGFFLKTDGNASFKNLVFKDNEFFSARLGSGFILSHGNLGTLTLDKITSTNIKINITAISWDGTGALVAKSAGPIIASNLNLNSISFPNPVAGSRYFAAAIGVVSNTLTMSDVTADGITINSINFSRTGGLVGAVLGNSSFTDIKITNLDLKTSQSAGGLIHDSQSDVTMTRVHISGSVYGQLTGGGLIAESGSFAIAGISIADSSFNGTITATSACGGLIAINWSKNLTVQRSYFKGSMPNVWSGKGAGIAAEAQGAAATVTISDSYAVATIHNAHPTNYIVVGLLGLAQGHVFISRSYFSGALTGTTSKACIANTAVSASMTISDTFFDSTVCNS